MDLETQVLYDYLAHRFQLFLPDDQSCSIDFLNQVEQGQKKALLLSETRDFYLPLVSFAPTKAVDLYKHCLSKPWLKECVDDNIMPNREFLIKIIATLELETLLELNRLILQKKFPIITSPPNLSQSQSKLLEKTDEKKNQVEIDETKKEKQEEINEIELERLLDVMSEIENEV